MDAAAPVTLSVRPVTVDDSDFLFALYAAAQTAAFDGIEPGQLAALLRRQFVAAEANHQSLHPAATHHVIELERAPIGQCRIGPHPDSASDAARVGDTLVLVDLTVLPEHEHLTGDVVAALHRHAEWFGARLWTDETASVGGQRTCRT